MSSVEQIPNGALFGGRYKILRCLKAGGMGAVYEVLDTVTRRRRALKVMLESLLHDPDLQARFAREATVTAEIDSEQVVETFDAGVSPEGIPFLVMELLRGEDLETLLSREQRLAPPEVVALLFQVAIALNKTREANVVHRDLKPANLFLTKREDGSARVKILDFGIAKIVENISRPRATKAFGTPLYMAPEQFHGETVIGPAADLYALSQIAYAMLVGEPYWSREASSAPSVYHLLLRMMEGIKESPCARAAKSGVTLPRGFDAWLLKAAHASASERFVNATEMIEELARALEVDVPHAQTRVTIAVVEQPLSRSEAFQSSPQLAGSAETRASRPDGLLETVKRVQQPSSGATPESASATATVSPTTAALASHRSGSPRSRKAMLVTLGVAMGVGVAVAAILALRASPTPGAIRASGSIDASATQGTTVVVTSMLRESAPPPASDAAALPAAPAPSAVVVAIGSAMPGVSVSAALPAASTVVGKAKGAAPGSRPAGQPSAAPRPTAPRTPGALGITKEF